jgi:acetyl esterase
MASVGPVWGRDVPGHVRLMIGEFTKVLADCPRDGIEVWRDISYGASARQRFDVFLPNPGAACRPAVLFVHGGAFVDGSRNRSSEVYSNVLRYFARSGVVGINVGYRLADEATFPEASRDVAAVVEWVQSNADKLGVDPSRIFLMGHSAGSAHVATYAYDPRVCGEDGPGIAGLIIVSGRVRADNRPENPNARKVEAYYGTDASLFDDRSAVSHVSAKSVPTFIAMAEFENPRVDLYCLELAHRLADAKGRAPPVYWLRGHNHTSIIAHFNTSEDDLGRAILAFMRDGGGRRY